MKKHLLILMPILLLVGCKNSKSEQEPLHWSHEACVEYIVNERGLSDYDYSAKEVSYEKRGDDEIRCFDITVFADVNYRYCCFTVVDGFELQYIDCDTWIGD